MSAAIPKGAYILLEFIGSIEAPQGYGTVYGNKQDRLNKPLTEWTIGEIIGAKPTFTKRFGSSACGRYQFMRATLQGLVAMQPGLENSVFTPAVQDQLGWALLIRRGYKKFVAGQLSRTAFGKALAQEWASFPVLAATQGQKREVKRGDTYYLGDGINKVLTTPAKIEATLARVLAADRPAEHFADTDLRSPAPEEAPEGMTEALAAPVSLFGPAAAVLGVGQPPEPVTLPGNSLTGLLSKLWALGTGAPPVKANERADVKAVVKEERPELSQQIGGIKWLGLSGLGLSGLGALTDSGWIDSARNAADEVTATAQGAQQLVNIIAGAIKWGVQHWYIFGILLSLWILAKVGWAVYRVYIAIQERFMLISTLNAIKDGQTLPKT